MNRSHWPARRIQRAERFSDNDIDARQRSHATIIGRSIFPASRWRWRLHDRVRALFSGSPGQTASGRSRHPSSDEEGWLRGKEKVAKPP